MALSRTLSKRLFNKSRESTVVTLKHLPLASQSLHETLTLPPNAAKINFHREFLTSPGSSDSGFFRRFLHRGTLNRASRLPESLSVPVGEKLKEKLCSMNLTGDRLRLDGLSPLLPSRPPPSDSVCGISVHDVKKIIRSSQLEKLRVALRQIPTNSIAYSEYVQTCADVCSNREQGTEYAKKLDESGHVIVLGNIVFLRPEQVAKSMEKIISNSIAIPNDPRRQELEEMEKQKAAIDQKAQQLVRGELYFGLGFLVFQTLGFMRLTFWELSWDVMEPICFFVTSVHFALAYGFFLRTSTEPTFKGYFQRRFKAKQKNLMKTHNFDSDKYNELCRAFYPNYALSKASDHVGEAAFGALNST